MNISKIKQYFEQNQDLRVLFVFDAVGDILSEIEAMEWAPPYRVTRFAGDWFATKCAIAGLPQDEKLILLMPMVSPLGNEDAMRAFPLLGELCANAQYSDNDYAAFMKMKGLPESSAFFVKAHLGDLQLVKFDSVLGSAYGTSFTADMGCRGILSVLLGESGIREWREIFVRLVTLDAEDTENSKKKLSLFSLLLTDRRYPDVLAALQGELRRTFGVELDSNKDPHLERVAASLRYNTVAQDLPVLKADNYKSLRTSDGVVINRMNQFLQYAVELPDVKRNDFFKAFERLAAGILMGHLTEVYGVDAKFGSYPPKLAREILARLAAKDFSKESASVRERAQMIAARTEAGKRMRCVAAYLATVAEFYLNRAKVKTFQLSTAEEYVVRYASEWFALDRNYRIAVEKFYAIESDDDRQLVEQVKKALDADYAVMTSECNGGWMAALKAAGGTADIASITHQQDFYRQFCEAGTKYVVVISDGLRYEVAKDIEARINAGRHKATLKSALAMLPSETKYCKPVLLPHLNAEFIDDHAGCFCRLDNLYAENMTERQNVLSAYDPEARCVDTAKLSQMTQAEKRGLFKNKLVYVYHDVIDASGHQASGKDVVKACSDTVEELVKLINSIHSTYNVANVLLTSDHGFLMNDVTFDDKDKIPVEATENPIEKTSRYYLTESATEIHGVTKFPLKTVSGFNEDKLVAVPDGTARFAAPGGYVYAHGGASLQELVIPILYSHSLRPDVREKVRVGLVNSKLQVWASVLKVQLSQDDAVSASVQGRTLHCALYAGEKRVSAEKDVEMSFTSGDPAQRVAELELTLSETPDTNILTFKAFDVDDALNPLVQAQVINKTLIERDF